MMGRIIRTVTGCLHAFSRTIRRRRSHDVGFRRRALCGIGCLSSLGLAVMLTPPASALSPVPFFRTVERVGVLCTVDTAPDAAAGAPEEGWLCRLAREELAAALAAGAPPGPWEVVALSRNDERLADPATLAVLLHANTRAQPAGGPALTAFAAALHRSGAGPAPFFLAPPEAVAAGDKTPDGEVRAALRRLLTAAAARPLLANR